MDSRNTPQGQGGNRFGNRNRIRTLHNEPQREFRANIVAPGSSSAAPSRFNSQAPRPQGQAPRQFNNNGGNSGRPQHGGQNASQGPARPNSVRRSVRNMRKPRSKPTLTNRGKMGDAVIPPVAPGTVRVIPIGGVEQIGQNMVMVETSDAILVVDAGFQFKEPGMPGIDFIIPNTKYIEERKDKVKGLFITHGHLDHIGAIPYVIEKLGYPPIYTRQFGAMAIAKRQDEFPQLKKLDIVTLTGDETVTLSPELKVTTFPISHTIPDSMGLMIDTPMGTIALIEDVRVDNIAGVVTDEEEEQYKRFKDKDILLLTMDSTSIEKPGFSLAEQTVAKNIEKIIRECDGRLIIATFASQVERIIAIVKAAKELGKKVVLEGRSMKSYMEIVRYLKIFEPDNIIPVEDIENYPPDRIVMIVTGGQGEEFSALTRIANKTHKYIRFRPTDTVLLSSSIIPVNFLQIVKLKDSLYRSDIKIITYLDSDVHASGHGSRDELKWIHNHINYKFFMPVHGYHYFLKLHADLAQSLGTPKQNTVVPDNGTIIEFYKDETGEAKMRVLKEKAPSNLVMVDGFAVGDMQEVVLRDRQLLSDDGMFVIVAVVDSRNGKLRKSPDIISRGFVYLRESQDLLRQARFIIKKTIEDGLRGARPHDLEPIKDKISDELGRYLFQQTAKRPIVIPVIIEV